MTAGSDPTRQEPRLEPARERSFGERRESDEPRFAGPPTAGMRPAPPMPTTPPPTTPPPTTPPPTTPPPASPPTTYSPAGYPQHPAPTYPPSATFPPPQASPPPPPPPASLASQASQSFATDLEPVVDYGPGVQPPDQRDALAISRAGSVIAVAGGLLAVLGSFFTWATLRLTATGPDGQGFTAEPSTITYNGLSLLEGRVALVLGIVAMGLAAAAIPRKAHRLLAFGLAVTGGLAVIVTAFAAIGHPVELATLFRSYRQIDAVKVSLPNGVGTWLAVIGALLILAGGFLALMRGSDVQREGPA